MGVSLYRKYRPQTFSDVVGQAGAVSVLEHAILNTTVGHAYLFSGSRGCGKTTLARILAKALNCLSPNGAEPCEQCANCRAITNGESLDVVEIDGASNNSVDEIRELKSHVALAPFSSKYKIYIIDEVHMLSTGAFNALLKTLEEPPAHVVFIMATTEPQKVPVTVRSRCQHIPFHSIGAQEITDRLAKICEWEKVAAKPEALWEIARQADGALRDALSMLEQVINRAQGEITLDDVESALGAGSRPALERWMSSLRQDPGAAYVALKAMIQEGASSQRIFEELFSLIKNVWLATCWPNIVTVLEISEQEKKFLVEESQNWSAEDLQAILTSLVGLITQARLGVRSDVLSGIFMLDLMRVLNPEPVSAVAPVPRKSLPEPALPMPDVSNLSGAPKAFSASRVLPDSRAEIPTKADVDNVNIETATETLSFQDFSETPVLSEIQGTPETPEKCAELLAVAKDADYVLYCGILNAIPHSSPTEQRLLLVMQDVYCFEALCQRFGPSWQAIRSLYPGGVFLRFQEKTVPVLELEQQERREKTNKRQVPKKTVGVGNRGAGVAKGWSRDSGLSPVATSQASTTSNISNKETRGAEIPFKDLVDDFTRILNGELLFVRRNFDETNVESESDADMDNDRSATSISEDD